MLWEAYLLAKAWRCRPSEIYAIEDELSSFCFDRAVNHFGGALEAELNSVEGKSSREIDSKRKRILQKWIPETSSSKPKFRDPAERFSRNEQLQSRDGQR